MCGTWRRREDGGGTAGGVTLLYPWPDEASGSEREREPGLSGRCADGQLQQMERAD